MKTTFAAFATVLGLPSIAAAQMFTVMDYSCATWAERRIDDPKRAEEYATGLLSGMAIGSQVDLWSSPTEIKPRDVAYYVDMYCEDNPLMKVGRAVNALAEERHGAYWNE